MQLPALAAVYPQMDFIGNFLMVQCADVVGVRILIYNLLHQNNIVASVNEKH